jgi:hypothetical protein
MRYIHSEERLPILDNGERLSFCEFGGLEGEAGRTQSLDPRTHSIFNNEKNIYPLEPTTKNQNRHEKETCVDRRLASPGICEFLFTSRRLI